VDGRCLGGRGGCAPCHQSMAEQFGVRPRLGLPIEITIPGRCRRSRDGLVIHRSDIDPGHIVERDGIPGVSVVVALVQIAPRLSQGELERAINQADGLDLIDPELLRSQLEVLAPMRGVKRLRETLDRRTFAMSRSELERRFRSIAKRAGLPKPETCVMRNGWDVDFLWRDLRLVVETDSLRYHRTAAQQTRDRLRDQAHLAAGDTPVRFSHSQVRFEPAYVERTLDRIVRRLRARQQMED
jgi:very-short-patch-repair endonuclease